MQLGGVLRAELLLQRCHKLMRAHARLIILVHDFIADMHVDPLRELLKRRVEGFG